MCNQRAALFMILKWYFKWIILLTFLCNSLHNHLPQTFALDQRFTALEVHERRPVTFLNCLRAIDHEVNTNFHTICNCYATVQVMLFVMVKIVQGLQRLCKILQTIRQDLAGSCSCELSAISFDFSLSSSVREDIINSIYGAAVVVCGFESVGIGNLGRVIKISNRTGERWCWINGQSMIIIVYLCFAVHKSKNFNCNFVSKIGNFMQRMSCLKKWKILDEGWMFNDE